MYFGLNNLIINIKLPSCKNCIYYAPNMQNNDFTSLLNKCNNFGEKNIVTDKINYEYAINCRKNETKCGKKGKYFKKEQNLKIKIFKHAIISNLSMICLVMTYLYHIIFLKKSLS